MKKRGMHGYLNDAHPKPTQDAFVNNFKQLRIHEVALKDEKAKGKNVNIQKQLD